MSATGAEDEILPADAHEDAATLAHIAVRIATSLPWLLLPGGMNCKFAQRPQLAPVPNVRPWFVGVYADRGVMTPVFDLGRWLDGHVAVTQGVAVLGQGENRIGFLCIEPPRVMRVAALDTETSEAAGAGIPESFRLFIGGARNSRAGICFDFQPFDWVHRNAQRVSASA